jgi:small subunit ribosomal protein S21
VEIRVQSQNIEKALRELKKRRHYEKPSVKKKNKQIEAEKRRRKLLKRARPSSSGPRPSRPSQSSATSHK